MAWPRIVAESLRSIETSARVARPVPAYGSLEQTLHAFADARSPARHDGMPPAFLHPAQHDSWRRAMAALDAWGGALLLESVGSGKTWIALGVAAACRGPVVAIVPAILRDQWRRAAESSGVAMTLWTHERSSRGAAPRGNPSLVIIDEAHRFRDASARRTCTIAPWLLGRRTLLLTATPIVNRIGDLVTLLRLALPEDALELDGLSRLGDLEDADLPPLALRRVAIRSSATRLVPIARTVTMLPADDSEECRGRDAVTAIASLELSTEPPIRRLLESVLLDSASSSDAAFRQALRRYLALLLQARDAGGATRAMLRRFAGESLDQLVLWPLLGEASGPGDLPLGDIARVEYLLRVAPPDERWIRALSARCDDPVPTIYFTRHRATAHALRTSFGDGVAWITGADAGIGSHRIPRAGLLQAFGPGRAGWTLRRTVPRVLVATDVAAEGLDLQSAGRIVHVDLPWTATRIEQREGRLLRLGQQHHEVEVIVRAACGAIEHALAPHARVRRKRDLAERWLHVLESADPAERERGEPPVSLVANDADGSAVVAIRLTRGRRSGAAFMRRLAGGAWRDERDFSLAPVTPLRPGDADPCLPCAAALFGDAARAAIASRAGRDSPAAALVARIHHAARRAAARRDGATLRQLDRLLRFITASPTLGGRMLLARLTAANDAELLRIDVPDAAVPAPLRASPIAALLFRPPEDGWRADDVAGTAIGVTALADVPLR